MFSISEAALGSFSRLSSPFEYDVILTFVRAHEELVYFIRSRSPKTAVIPGLYLIAFVYLVPFATEKVRERFPYNPIHLLCMQSY